MTPVKVGLIGCGTISATYLKVAKQFPVLEIVACADALPERAEARAAEFGVPRALGVDELIADPEIEIVLNLTIPKAHGEVGLRAVEAGKSVYNEKPLAVTREEGRQLVERAKAKGVRVGAAPDTFLGGGIQTCLELLDSGAIGQPVAAVAFMAGHGHESWHPDPAFYYQAGGGPMFDMGPYYLTALIALLGPMRRATGSARVSFSERTITSKPKHGEKIAVEVPTHVAGVIDFAQGAVGALITSFDVWGHNLPRIEIYGSEGSLSVPDPNTFGGPVLVKGAADKEWREVPVTRPHTDNSRSLGLADMAEGLRSGRAHRASGELAYHVLEAMHAFHDASATGRHVELVSSCARPEPLLA